MTPPQEPASESPTRRPADERPFDHTPIDTDDLPATPTRDRNISATAWKQAPASLLTLGADLGIDPDAIAYKRRFGTWLLWRAGPARGPANYLAINSTDVEQSYPFTLGGGDPDHGVGPSGASHTRFRDWKEDLLGRAARQD